METKARKRQPAIARETGWAGQEKKNMLGNEKAAWQSAEEQNAAAAAAAYFPAMRMKDPDTGM